MIARPTELTYPVPPSSVAGRGRAGGNAASSSANGAASSGSMKNPRLEGLLGAYAPVMQAPTLVR